MPLNFPSSPTDGQIYSGYQYNAAKDVWDGPANFDVSLQTILSSRISNLEAVTHEVLYSRTAITAVSGTLTIDQPDSTYETIRLVVVINDMSTTGQNISAVFRSAGSDVVVNYDRMTYQTNTAGSVNALNYLPGQTAFFLTATGNNELARTEFIFEQATQAAPTWLHINTLSVDATMDTGTVHTTSSIRQSDSTAMDQIKFTIPSGTITGVAWLYATKTL